jgi:hypothetical protein
MAPDSRIAAGHTSQLGELRYQRGASCSRVAFATPLHHGLHLDADQGGGPPHSSWGGVQGGIGTNADAVATEKLLCGDFEPQEFLDATAGTAVR